MAPFLRAHLEDVRNLLAQVPLDVAALLEAVNVDQTRVIVVVAAVGSTTVTRRAERRKA